MTRALHRVVHLVARFFGSLVPRRVGGADRAWVAEALRANEYEVWARMPRADRVESIDVARRAARAIGDVNAALLDDAVAAALLHDCGKTDARLGTFGRAIATVIGIAAGQRARAWTGRRGFAGAVGRYLVHAARGGEILQAIGARPAAVGWATAHHDATQWPVAGLDLATCRALAAADGE